MEGKPCIPILAFDPTDCLDGTNKQEIFTLLKTTKKRKEIEIVLITLI